MRPVFQLVSVLAVALGVGLIVAGFNYSSDHNAKNPAHVVTLTTTELRDIRHTSTILLGFGSGFLTVGCLGLIVPWVNAGVYGRRGGTGTPSPPPTSG